ncbi:hypothetical protein MBLNU230_g4074t1 [Neophaeotheca triangularis]
MSSKTIGTQMLRQARQSLAPSRTGTRCLHQLPRRPHPKSHFKGHARNGGNQQKRHVGTFIGNTRSLFRSNPISMTVATGAILFGIFSWGYVHYINQTYIIGAFHKFPDPVAKKLRKALYFTNIDLRPKEALKFYKQALQVAEELGMDPFSDEIMGVKIQVAALMEKLQQWSKAIQVLEILRADSLEWLRQFGEREHNKEKRTRVLAKCVAMSVKLGELYAQPAIYDRDAAEERMVWAVETALKESQRRESLGVKAEEEGEWLSPEEQGAAFESLAHSYEAKDQHYLATPLFLQALSLHPTKNCHTVTLMSNLASSLGQQSPRAAAAAQAYARSQTIPSSEQPDNGPPATKETMVNNARTWAQKALELAATIKPPERDEECDVGCAVATHNLGEFAEMLGDVAEARQKYQESVSLARAVGFQEGVEMSSERLRALSQSK